MRQKITPGFLEEVLALDKVTWSWTFPPEMMHYLTIDEEDEPFEVMIEKMDQLSDASYCAVAFPYNKVSRSTLHKWMKEPELILEVDDSYLPEYVDKQTSYDFLGHIESYRKRISGVLRELWENVFKEEWPGISALLAEELSQKKALFEKTDLSIQTKMKSTQATIIFSRTFLSISRFMLPCSARRITFLPMTGLTLYCVQILYWKMRSWIKLLRSLSPISRPLPTRHA